MSNCPKCGAALQGVKFCPNCGTPVEATDSASTASMETTGSMVGGAVVVEQAPTAAHARFDSILRSGKSLLMTVTPERYVKAALQALIVYVATWAVGAIATALALIGDGGASADWSWLFEAPGQLISLALGGIVSAHTGVLGISASVSLMGLPLLFTAAVIVGVGILSRRDEKLSPTPSRGSRWLLSVLVGLVLAIVSLLIAAVLPVVTTLGDSTGILGSVLSAHLTVSAASVTQFFGAFIIGTLVSYRARVRVAGSRTRDAEKPAAQFRGIIAATFPAVGLYFATAAAFLVLAIVIVLIAGSTASALWTALLWLPTAVATSLSFVNLSAITASGSALSVPGAAAFPSSTWMPSVLPAWATVLVLVLNILLIVVVGLVLALRRASLAPNRSISWTTTIVSFGAAGVVISVLGSVVAWSHLDTGALGGALDGVLGSNSTSSGLSGLGAAGSAALDAYSSLRLTIGPAAWTFIVFIVLGALVEACATYLAPWLLPLLPTSGVQRVGSVLARFGVPLSADASAAPAATGVVTAEGTSVDGITTAPNAIPMTPERKRRLRLIIAWAGGAIVVVVLAIIAISVLNQTVFSPKRQVEAYLNSIESKDASRALQLGDIDAANSERVLLTNAVLESTSSGISGYSIVSSTTAGDQATVVVEVTQDGSKLTLGYTLHRAGSVWLFFHSWKMGPTGLPTLSVQLSDGISSLKINGTTVPVSANARAEGVLQLPAFPGKYTVALGGESDWLSAKQQTVVVGAALTGSAASVSLSLAPTPAFRDSLTKQIQTFLTGCAAQTTLTPDGCPFEDYGFGTITQVHWTISGVPKLSLTPSDDGQWAVTTTQEGTASVSYDEDFFGVTPESDSVDFEIVGSVSLATGKPVFSYESGF